MGAFVTVVSRAALNPFTLITQRLRMAKRAPLVGKIEDGVGEHCITACILELLRVALL